jgi:hypothetical protein
MFKHSFFNYSLHYFSIQIEKILSSSNLHVQNEDQLFKFILEKAEQDPGNFILMKHVFGCYSKRDTLFSFTEFILLGPIDLQIFNFIKNCFKFRFLFSNESKLQKIIQKPILEYIKNEEDYCTNQLIFNSLPEPYCDSTILYGMTILRNHRTDSNKLEEAFPIFKEVTDEYSDPEACRRVAA